MDDNAVTGTITLKGLVSDSCDGRGISNSCALVQIIKLIDMRGQLGDENNPKNR